jgi:4-hydroxybenzoate polyprenyltransferase
VEWKRNNPNGIIHHLTDPFIFGSFIISFCTVALYCQTYLQLGLRVKLDSTAPLVFFATLFLYNFHRLIGVRRILPENHGVITGWAANNQFALLILTLAGAVGVVIFLSQTSYEVILVLILLGSISLLYELPVVRYHHQFQRLRNLGIYKVFMITSVWAVTTTVLPAINAGISITNHDLLLIVIERMLFIFLLALCFDVRDIEFDKKEDLKTIPVRYGIRQTVNLYRIITLAFLLIISLNYFILSSNMRIGIAMIFSIGCTFYTVTKTSPPKSDYYYLFLVDGMMIVQFLVTWLFSAIM